MSLGGNVIYLKDIRGQMLCLEMISISYGDVRVTMSVSGEVRVWQS